MNSTTLIVLGLVALAGVAYLASQKPAAPPTQTNQSGASAFTFGLSVPIK